MARKFNGSSDVLKTGAFNTPGRSTTEPLTISTWINPTATAGTYTWLGANNSVATGGLQVRISSGAIQFLEANVSIIASFSPTMSTNQWALVEAVFDVDGSSKLYYYLNGVLQSASSGAGSTGTISTRTQGFFIGSSSDGSGNATQFWSGGLADIAIWNARLTDTDAAQLALGVRPNNVKPKKLLNWWPLDEPGGVAVDRTGGRSTILVTGTSFVTDPSRLQSTPYRPFITQAA